MILRKRPPGLVRWLLSRLILYDTNHSILSDFEESYNAIRQQKGSYQARMGYISQVLRSLPHYFRFILSTGFGLLIRIAKKVPGSLRCNLAVNANHNFFNIDIGPG
jgi:hypothetical protein